MFSCFRYPETATAIAFENQGFFEQAQSTYEQVNYKTVIYSFLQYLSSKLLRDKAMGVNTLTIY